jgi:hypothetical protein
MAMRQKHYGTAQWIDFVNERITSAKRTEMQQHLEGGCAGCAKEATAWQRVRQSAVAEASYQPPADTLRVVKAAFGGSELVAGRKRRRSAVELLFDSLLQPVLQGARSASSGMRQVLYRAEPYQIDVQIEATPSGRRLMVTGQVLDVTHAQTVGREIPVVLSNLRGETVRTLTNEFGEFNAQLENSGDLELSVVGVNCRPVVISLREALGRAAGGRL